MPIGMLGSPAHVMTNNEVVDKKGCMKALLKEGAKDTLVLTGAVAGAGVAASAISKNSGAVKTFVQNGINWSKNLAKNVLSENAINKVKDLFQGVPKHVKVGIAAGAAAFALIAPLFTMHSAQKAAKIEGKYEV